MSEISKAEFADWKSQPVTQEVLKVVAEARQATEGHLLYGGTIGENTAEETARAVGVLQGLDMLLAVDFEE